MRAARNWMRAGVKQVHGLLGTHLDQVDPLVALVRHDSVSAAWFIEVLMLSSGILSAVACAVCTFLLAFRWRGSEGCCDRPLRLWLIVHAGLQAVQVPVRVRFSARMRAARNQNSLTSTTADGALWDVALLESCVATITGNRAWKVLRFVSLITYAWLAIGLVWVMNVSTCEGCASGLPCTCVLMMALVGFKAVCVAYFFNSLFGSSSINSQSQDQETSRCSGGLCAAMPDEIASLPKTCYADIKLTTLGSNHTACAVCCSEYQDRDVCRILPCGHHFHQRCVDRWLQRSTRCPLCMGSIRAAAGAEALPQPQLQALAMGADA